MKIVVPMSMVIGIVQAWLLQEKEISTPTTSGEVEYDTNSPQDEATGIVFAL